MALCALSVGDMFSLGGITTLLGLGMTFIVLIILIGCIFIMDLAVKKLTTLLQKRKDAKNGSVLAEEPIAETPSVATIKEIDAETMTAIRSAIKIYVTENNADGKPHENVTIKSVTKV